MFTFDLLILGKRKGTHFSTKDLEMLGAHFCDTILDYCDPNRTKVGCLFESKSGHVSLWSKDQKPSHFCMHLRTSGFKQSICFAVQCVCERAAGDGETTSWLVCGYWGYRCFTMWCQVGFNRMSSVVTEPSLMLCLVQEILLKLIYTELYRCVQLPSCLTVNSVFV